MHTSDLRNRIPKHIRERAEKAKLEEPDWYVGPLKSDADADDSSPASGADKGLEDEMKETEEDQSPAPDPGYGIRLMRWFQRVFRGRPRFSPGRQRR